MEHSKKETESQRYFRWARQALESARTCPVGSTARQLHLQDAADFRATAKRHRHPRIEAAIQHVARVQRIPLDELRRDYVFVECSNGDVDYAYRHTNSGWCTVRAAVISRS